jgi:hypothetical protein
LKNKIFNIDPGEITFEEKGEKNNSLLQENGLAPKIKLNIVILII